MFVIAVLATVAPGAAFAQSQPADEPFRLGNALGVPSWLEVSLAHRSRLETLNNDFRASATAEAPDPLAVALRTLAAAVATIDFLVARVELQDSRTAVADDGGRGESILNPTIVNPLEVLEAYVGVQLDDAMADGATLAVRAGRLTLDVGKRRLVARNRFRNTINGFAGIDAQWTSARGHEARAFAVVPVARRPADADGLEGNDIELDEHDTDALLWLAYYGAPILGPGVKTEYYALGFHERDGDRGSRDRQLGTLVSRAHRRPALEYVDFEVEAALQLGRSSATAAADAARLDHVAFFLHAEAGYTFDVRWQPRLLFQFDYASGDRDPTDGANGRFDTLFGARRFDFGPTGIFGAFARANVNSPAVRVFASPTAVLSGFVAYRAVWLASARDAWTAAGIADPTGAAGTFVGQQVEARLRWDVLPGNLRFEVGGAGLLRGRFAREAPGGRSANGLYLYTQATLEL